MFFGSLCRESAVFHFMTIFYNMTTATIWAAGSVRQLLIYGSHPKHKVNNPVQIGFTQIFDIVKKVFDFLIHMAISL